jgi:hypothetical protein
MRKVLALTLSILLVFSLVLTGCMNKANNKQNDVKLDPIPGTGTTEKGQSSNKVISPEQVLSADEASLIVMQTVKIESNTLTQDKDTGKISLRYVYDINKNTVSALLMIEQDSLKPADKIKAGKTAKKSFESDMKFFSKYVKTVEGIGDTANYYTSNGNLQILYKGYYITVCFRKEEYPNPPKDAELNILLGKRIVANMKDILK